MDDEKTPIKNLANDIEDCLDVQTIPLITGPAGVGKSELVRAIARRRGVQLYTLIGSMCDPTDINGFPVVAADRRVKSEASGRDHPVLEFAPRDWLIRANQPPGAIIFLDELASSPPNVLAAMLHLLTQWQAGDFDLDPTLVSFVAATNAADEAVNGTELGFPMVNRLTHFDFPVDTSAAREWTANFPGYWGHPKRVSVRGKALAETHLIAARSAVAGFIHRTPHNWHHVLWEAQTAEGKEKGKKAETRGSSRSPTGGAVTPRAWDRVSRHVALARARGLHPLTAMRRIVGEVGPGPAAAFEAHLTACALPDPETLIADPTQFSPAGRMDHDFSTVMAVVAAVLADLTPERVEAAMTVLNLCANPKNGGPQAKEAGAAGVIHLFPVLQGDSDLQKNLLRGMTNVAKTRHITKLVDLAKPYLQIMKKMHSGPTT